MFRVLHSNEALYLGPNSYFMFIHFSHYQKNKTNSAIAVEAGVLETAHFCVFTSCDIPEVGK